MARRGTHGVNRKGTEYTDGEWSPELVGQMGWARPPKATKRAQLNANREKARQSGRLLRTGVPNGWAGRKAELAELRRNATTDAERLVEVTAQEAQQREYDAALCAFGEECHGGEVGRHTHQMPPAPRQQTLPDVKR